MGGGEVPGRAGTAVTVEGLRGDAGLCACRAGAGATGETARGSLLTSDVLFLDFLDNTRVQPVVA